MVQLENKFCKTLLNVFNLIEPSWLVDGTLNINTVGNANLLELGDLSIKFPLPSLKDKLFSFTSPLSDSFVSDENFKDLMKIVKPAMIRLNHIGFCYYTTTRDKDLTDLIAQFSKTDLHLYQEPSNDSSLWLFAGNTEDWQKPLFEIIPITNRSDKWVDYWLPNFQIDIDTTLTAEEIENAINQSFGGKVLPYKAVVIDGVVYVIRARLGVVSGINISLDLATSKRNVEYLRTKTIKKLV